MEYKIIVDSCCELPENLKKDERFERIPLGLEVGDYHVLDDENFDQQTVVKRGTLQAARLVLRPKVIANEVRDGRRKAVTRTFVMELADLRTGLVMWKFTKQLGFIKEQRIVGW